MRTHYYLLIVRDGIEPELKGPFPTDQMRDLYAKRYRKSRLTDADDALFPLDVDAQGTPTVSTYSGGFFER